MKNPIPFNLSMPQQTNGRPVKCQSDKTMFAALQAALAKSEAIGSIDYQPGTVTLNAVLDEWLNLHTIGLKPRSVEFNKDIVRHIRKAWPQALERPVGGITEAECLAFAARVAHYSSSRYNGMVHCLRHGVPAAKVLPRKAPPHPDAQIPTAEVFDQLIAALDTCHSGHSGLIVRLLAHTGMRITEATKLKWADVRDDHIYMRAETTKNGKPRCIPFIAGTREILRALRRVSPGQFVLTQGTCRRALMIACKLIGCPMYSHHTFRHYFATRCIVSGVDIPTVAKWLGHTDGGIVLLKTYCHLMDEHSRAMADRVRTGGTMSNPEVLVTLHATPQARFLPPLGKVVAIAPDAFKANAEAVNGNPKRDAFTAAV